VLPTGAGHPQWGPKDQIAFIKDGLAVLDLATGGRVSFPTDHDHEYTDFVWLKDGRIVAIYGFQSFTSQLVILDPKKPTAPPMELGAPTIGPERHQALALDVKGKLLYTVKTPLDPNPGADERRNKEPYRLCRLDLTQRPPREEVLVPYLAGGARIFVGGDGKAYLGCPTTGSYQVADLSSNQVANWQPPQIACPDSTFRAAVFPVPADFVALPGGGLVFSADYYSGKPQDERAQVIYTCGADGRASRLITHPEKRLIDTYVFPVSRKAAF